MTYVEDGVEKVDAVRSYKMVDIFDAYYDFGLTQIKSIVSGFGSIKPKLYNPNPRRRRTVEVKWHTPGRQTP